MELNIGGGLDLLLAQLPYRLLLTFFSQRSRIYYSITFMALWNKMLTCTRTILELLLVIYPGGRTGGGVARFF